jgi:uncharacterized protein YcbX
MMHLSSIHIYPLKSARGLSLDHVALDEFGLRSDRRWMVVDATGRFISQRECHRLALVTVGITPEGLLIDGPGMTPLAIRFPAEEQREVPVQIWDDTCGGVDGGEAAAEWFTRFIGAPARIVYMPDGSFRRVNARYVPEPRRVSFADAYPILLVGESSLADLNRRMSSPLPMNRFRPNLVITGSPPFAEDGWRSVRIGSLEFDIVKPCDRCVTTTIDQFTGEQGKEPLRTLARFRKWNGQVYFGQNIVHRKIGTLAVGDAVTL